MEACQETTVKTEEGEIRTFNTFRELAEFLRVEFKNAKEMIKRKQISLHNRFGERFSLFY